ncbi:hypothetical protein ACFSR9_11915 [Deinococcus taklimakanensis]|uniref:HEPN domain-containing protein n=1 Tax=Deinococcus taklimakanensis TaxID=536443 RepID=A0ABW5P6T4_9DEIO
MPDNTPNNPKVVAHIAKAFRFEAERDQAALSAEWQVIVEFYSVLHWMRAACAHIRQERGRQDRSFKKLNLNGHGAFETAMKRLGLPGDVQDDYIELRDFSEWARYGIVPEKEITPDVTRKATARAVALRAWAVGELLNAGYNCTSATPPPAPNPTTPPPLLP